MFAEDVQHWEGEEHVDGARSGRQSIDHLELYLFVDKCPTLVFLGVCLMLFEVRLGRTDNIYTNAPSQAALKNPAPYNMAA